MSSSDFFSLQYAIEDLSRSVAPDDVILAKIQRMQRDVNAASQHRCLDSLQYQLLNYGLMLVERDRLARRRGYGVSTAQKD